jgi:glucose-6-phosphate isomerase, archaeal
MLPDIIQAAFSLQLDLNKGILLDAPQHTIRLLSALSSIFQDEKAYREALTSGDRIVYEMYETDTPQKPGELQFSIDTIYPGYIGAEYHMTRGHAHDPKDCVELYIGIRGIGLILLEREDGSFITKELCAGRIVYVPSYCLHRTVNTGNEPLVFLSVSPAHAKIIYDAIPASGFRYLVVRGQKGPEVVPNPKRLP